MNVAVLCSTDYFVSHEDTPHGRGSYLDLQAAQTFPESTC